MPSARGEGVEYVVNGFFRRPGAGKRNQKWTKSSKLLQKGPIFDLSQEVHQDLLRRAGRAGERPREGPREKSYAHKFLEGRPTVIIRSPGAEGHKGGTVEPSKHISAKVRSGIFQKVAIHGPG